MIGMIPFVFAVGSVWSKRASWAITRGIKNSKGESDVEQLILILIKLIERRDRSACYLRLQGFLAFHASSCLEQENNCPCRELRTDKDSEEMNVEDNKKDHQWYLLIKYLIKEALLKFPRSSRLRLLLAHIEYNKLKQVWLAIYSLRMIPELKPSIQE